MAHFSRSQKARFVLPFRKIPEGPGAMNEDKKPPRSWRDVAQEVCTEQNPRRLSDLIEELNKSLEKELTKQSRVSA